MRSVQERMISMAVGPKGASGRPLGGQRLLSFISQLKAVGVTLFIISPRKVVQHPEWAPLEVKGSVDCATQSLGTQKCLPLVAGRAPLEWVDHPETHLYSIGIAQDKREVLPVECNPRQYAPARSRIFCQRCGTVSDLERIQGWQLVAEYESQQRRP